MLKKNSYEILITEKEIKTKVKELGKRISQDYQGKELTIIGVLKGAVIFLSDLLRYITIPCEVDFIGISSYGDYTKSSGVVRITKDLDESIESKHILIVEDIVDTGLTLQYLINNLQSRKVASLKVCALLDKPSRRKVEVKIDYLGFTIPDRFIMGYGLDYQEKYRNVPYIFYFKENL
jgi:hypoxanthine phosphoribosyltransferase